MRRRQQGFMLVELLLAVVLTGMIILALMNAFTVAYATAKDARMLEVAQRLAELTMDSALTDPLAESVSSVPFDGLPGYRYDLAIAGVADSENVYRTRVVVTVKYRFLTGEREFRLEAWRYGI